MICIFSSVLDLTTTDVMRWLHYFGITDVLRINYDDAVHDRIVEFNVDQDTLTFRIDGRDIALSEIDAVWYRKGRHWMCNTFLGVEFREHPKFAAYIAKKMAVEELRLSEYLHFLIENTVPELGSPVKCDLNKLQVLHAARQVGLLTPGFRVTNSREALKSALAEGPIITKPISDVLYLFETEETNVGYFSYTETLSDSALDALPERVSPSFVQEEIQKKFEVRAFFLDGKCYPMAIFSQADEQTRVDFRQYNYTKPNRAVPFKLPADIDSKIVRLFKHLGLNTGSVDLLVDQQGRFFFLEINPVGQFEMVSRPCNYFLEKQVALTLRQYATRNRSN